MHKKTNIILLILVLFFSNYSYSKSVYDTDFHHVEIITDNAFETKSEIIKIISNKSFFNIIDRILTYENKNFFLKKVNYENDLEKFIQNIIIENELITNNKYIADIKINFDKKKIISLFRKIKVSYSDIISNPYLVLSTYTEEFATSGLTTENLFYDKEKLKILKSENYLINMKIPELSPNDRFIIPYKFLIEGNIESLLKISDKYNVENLFLIQIKKNDNKSLNIKIYFYSDESDEILFIGDMNLNNYINLHDHIFSFLDDWWKNRSLINNNKVNSIVCQIQSNSYADLLDIKSKILSLSQFKSIKLQTISYNNNIEKIEFFGDNQIFVKSLFLKKINVFTDNDCIINTISE